MTTEDEAKFMLVEGISLKEYIDRRVREEVMKRSPNPGRYSADGTWVPAGKFINCDGDVVTESVRRSY